MEVLEKVASSASFSQPFKDQLWLHLVSSSKLMERLLKCIVPSDILWLHISDLVFEGIRPLDMSIGDRKSDSSSL